MKTLALFLLSLCCGLMSLAQSTQRFQIERTATVNLSEIPIDYGDVFQPLGTAPKPGSPLSKHELRDYYARIAQKRAERSGELSIPANKTTNDIALDREFDGNLFSNSLPNDNDLAVGHNGQILSVTNTTVYVFDTNGTSLVNASLEAFGNEVGPLTRSYDPRCLYDPDNRRYITVFLEGSLDSTSKIVVAFSQTEDASGFWNFYALPGNPNDDGTWSDFPTISLNQQDLFIAVNRFTNNSVNDTGFTETVFWQVGLDEGYAGDALQSVYHEGLYFDGTDTLFNVCPVRGEPQALDREMYLLGNRLKTEGSDSIYVLHVTGAAADATPPSIEWSLVNMPSDYRQPAPAPQLFNRFLDTNDGRVQGAIVYNNRIHFVSNTLDTFAVKNGVYYGVIDLSNMTGLTAETLLAPPNYEAAYPDITLERYDVGEEVFISTLVSNADDPPGSGVFHFPLGESNAYAFEKLYAGIGGLALQFGNTERWGDYTGMVRDFSRPGAVWMAGSYGGGSNQNLTRLFRLSLDGAVVGREAATSQQSQLNLRPNPARDRLTIDFELPGAGYYEVDVLDLSGSVVRRVWADKLKGGTNRYSFNVDAMPAGTYLLDIRSAERGFRMSKKFVVSH